MPGIRSVLVHPYVLFYRIAARSVEAVRVLHQRRDLDAIFAGNTQADE
jgi:plasmid stabilization system protein ParE